MSPHACHRPAPIPRIAVLLVFAFGLVAQPVLGALGEIHGLTTHADSINAHWDHNVLHDHAPISDAGDHGTGDPMHLLFDYVHCCGHVVWLTGAAPLVPNYYPVSAGPPAAAAQAVTPSHATPPYKPPIVL